MHPNRHRRAALAALTATAVAALATLAACGGTDAVEPVITTQPVSVTVREGAPATFTVEAAGTDPISFAWLDASNDTPVTGATAPTLSLDATTLADNGRSFKALLTNPVGSTASQVATLTVTERSVGAATDVLTLPLRTVATVVDSNGHTHVVSMNGNAQTADVQAHVKPRASDALQPLAVLQAPATLTTDFTSSLRLAANHNGFVMAVWHRDGVVMSALYRPPTTGAPLGAWQAPVRVSAASAHHAADPAVAAVGNGFEVVWRQRMTAVDPHDMLAAHHDIVNNTWSTVSLLESSSDDTLAPQLVADAAGNLIAAWTYSEGGVVINRRAAGAAWDNATTQVEGAPGYRLGALKANAAGQGILLTNNPLDGSTLVRLDLASATPVSSIGGIQTYGSAPDAHVFPDGRIRVVGVLVDADAGNASRLFEWAYMPPFGWSGATPVSDIATSDFVATGHGVTNPQVAGADTAGNLLVTWEETDTAHAGRGRIQVRRHLAAQNAWRDIVTVAPGGTGSTDHREPRAAMSPDGSATVVFRDVQRGALGAADFR